MMDTITAPKPLYGPIRARVNKLAHEQGLRHEHALRVSMLAQLERARDGGESFAQLCERMAQFELNLGH